MRWRYFAILSLILYAGFAGAVFSAQLPPPPTQYIVDDAGVLKSQDVSEINRMLAEIERETSCQVVVAIYAALPPGESLEDYANKLFRAWGIGQKNKNNGVLILIFIKDRKLRIEVGYGLEGSIPDAIAKRIIDEKIVPNFRIGNYSGGIKSAIITIKQAISGEYKPQRNTRAPLYIVSFLPFLLVPIAIIFTLIRMTRYIYTGGGRYRRYDYYRDGWIFNNWGGGSGGGGGFSSGGFSGGGGSSGGGGASGSW